MEEIKFRGQRVDNKQWVYGYYFKTPLTDEATNSKPEDGWFFLSGRERHCISQNGCVYEVISETIGQYTGRKNNDGKEIYDGDICESIDGIFLVTWNEEKSAFVMVFQDGERLYLEEMWEDTKIIGNINDNSDFIKLIKLGF